MKKCDDSTDALKKACVTWTMVEGGEEEEEEEKEGGELSSMRED